MVNVNNYYFNLRFDRKRVDYRLHLNVYKCICVHKLKLINYKSLKYLDTSFNAYNLAISRESLDDEHAIQKVFE